MGRRLPTSRGSGSGTLVREPVVTIPRWWIVVRWLLSPVGRLLMACLRHPVPSGLVLFALALYGYVGQRTFVGGALVLSAIGAECTVRVESTVAGLNGSDLLLDQPPKSDAGRRVVAFPAYLRPMLDDHLKSYTGEGADSYVFTRPKGTALRRSNFRPVWVKATADAGLASVRVHDLRHTGATIAAQSGATLRELMNRIGHSTARAAINYQHAANGRDQEIATALDKLIKKERGKKRPAGESREE